jgi:hypothetical protein
VVAHNLLANERAKRVLLQYLRQEPTRMHMVGPIALWLCGGYPVERVEELLEELTDQGILRHATPDELEAAGCRHGYFVTPEGLASLPPEVRSYGST